MKVVCISDTHCKHDKIKIPACDLLLHAGDFTSIGKYLEISNFIHWFAAQPATHKVFIAGNHELTICPLQGNPSQYRELFTTLCSDYKIHYLNNSHVVVDGIKIYGTPWTPKYYDWAFNGEDDELANNNYPKLKDIYANIPLDIDILLSHGPPFGYLDEAVRTKDRVGSKSLLKAIDERPNLKYVVFGHIHYCGGRIVEYNGKKLINAASLNEDYVTLNPLIEFEYEQNTSRE